MFKKITSENANIYAIKHYENPHCENEKEFHVLYLFVPHIIYLFIIN